MDNKEVARFYYLEQGKTGKEIARILGIQESQVSRWKKEEGWDNLKTAQSLTTKYIEKNILEQAKKITEKEEFSVADADKLSKLAAFLKSIEKSKPSIVQQIEVIQTFIEHIMTLDLAFAKKVKDYAYEYINKIMNET